jgi:hypothetical protein
MLTMMSVLSGADIFRPALLAMIMMAGIIKSITYLYPYWLAPLLEYKASNIMDRIIEHQQPPIHQFTLIFRTR